MTFITVFGSLVIWYIHFNRRTWTFKLGSFKLTDLFLICFYLVYVPEFLSFFHTTSYHFIPSSYHFIPSSFLNFQNLSHTKNNINQKQKCGNSICWQRPTTSRVYTVRLYSSVAAANIFRPNSCRKKITINEQNLSKVSPSFSLNYKPWPQRCTSNLSLITWYS